MKISIITVCYNSEETIRDTFESVLKQTYKNYEYIVVDGKSSDSTLKVIKEYKKKFSNENVLLKYISEKDNGLYDAMNKGIKMCSGDIIGIINSDDIIHDNEAFKNIVDCFCNDNCDATYSDLYIMDYESMSIPNRVFIAGKKNYKYGWYPPHPTLYLKKEIYDKYGLYSTKYKIAADYDFMLRIMKNNINFSYIRKPLVYMRAGGVSTNSFKAYIASFKEGINALKENGVKMPYLVNVIRTMVIFKQRIMGLLKIGIKNTKEKR